MGQEYKGHVYQGKSGDWYWRIVATNGNLIADGAEGYKNRAVAKKMLENIITSGSTGKCVLILEDTEAEKLKKAKKAGSV